MSTPFLSEIKIFSFGYAPKGWAFCNGQLMPINQFQALFSLLGTSYGGDGRLTFGLPNLQGRTPLHWTNGQGLGQPGGEANHTLSLNELPGHTHTWSGTNTAATTPDPGNALLGGAKVFFANVATTPPILVPLYSAQLAVTGASQGHQNMQHYLALNFCISLTGIFPSRN